MGSGMGSTGGGGGGWAMELHNLYKRNATHTHPYVCCLPFYFHSVNSNVTQGSKGTHGQFATPPSPPPHTSPRLPAIHLPACRPAPCCCPLPGLIAKRAWAHGKHSSCLFFFGLSCHSLFPPFDRLPNTPPHVLNKCLKMSLRPAR